MPRSIFDSGRSIDWVFKQDESALFVQTFIAVFGLLTTIPFPVQSLSDFFVSL